MSRRDSLGVTSKGLNVLYLLLPLTVTAWLMGEPTYIYASTVLAMATLLDLVAVLKASKPLREVSVVREVSSRMAKPGMEIKVTLRVSSKADFEVKVVDRVPKLLKPLKRPVFQLCVKGGSASVGYVARVSGPGRARFSSVELIVESPLKLFSVASVVKVGGEVICIPEVIIPRVKLPSLGYSVYSEEGGGMSFRVGGREFSFIRRYQSGDEARSISWKHVARDPLHRLWVKDRRMAGRRTSVIVMDWYEGMLIPEVQSTYIKVAYVAGLVSLANDEQLILINGHSGEVLRGLHRENIFKLIMKVTDIRPGLSLEQIMGQVGRIRDAKFLLIAGLERSEAMREIAEALSGMGYSGVVALIDTPSFIEPMNGAEGYRAAWAYLLSRYQKMYMVKWPRRFTPKYIGRDADVSGIINLYWGERR